MTDIDLDAIRERNKDASEPLLPHMDYRQQVALDRARMASVRDVPALLAEVERLRLRLAASMPFTAAEEAIARVKALCDAAEREQGCSEALLNSDQVRAALRGDQP